MGGYNRSVASDNRLPVIIFVLLAGLVATPLVWNRARDARRPRLVDARIVMATADDPVFRTGPRHVAADDEVVVALALQVEEPRGRRWLAPAEELQIDGERVEHTLADGWPEADRQLRIFWFTVESSNVGGVVAAENAASTLRYRTYLATEMGQAMVADQPPEAHNDDHLGELSGAVPVTAGTIRMYAKAEIFDPGTSAIKAVQACATAGPDRILEPGFPAIHRSLEQLPGIQPVAGELFNLPCWEAVAEPGSRDAAAAAAFGLPFNELVKRRILTSSATFAAVTTTGSPVAPKPAPDGVTEVALSNGTITRGRRPIDWNEIDPGDWIVEDEHVFVLAEDDGNGVLDVGDTVLHCWHRSPSLTTLGAALSAEPARLSLVRHGR